MAERQMIILSLEDEDGRTGLGESWVNFPSWAPWERAEALKRDNYTCCDCGKKQSVKKGFECKVQVHHKKGIKIWNVLIDLIYKHLLCNPDDLETLCVDCHDKRE